MSMITPHITGDAHLGRKFIEFVPLHRRGDRERMVMNEFKHNLASCISPLFVQTGDLFDGFSVDDAVVLEAALAVREEAKKNPGRTYVFYRGNHDASKDADKASSFDVFAEILHGLPNVHVLKDPEYLRETETGQVFGFIPWSPFKSAAELAQELIDRTTKILAGKWDGKFDIVFGHWDTECFNGKDFNLVPTKILAPVTKEIVTGHVHTPGVFERDGVKVAVVGSMQPYSHSEDPNDSFYTTIDFETYQHISRDLLRNMNVRVLVKEGQNPEPCDCLSFKTKLVTEKTEEGEAPDLEVKIEDFSMDRLFLDSLQGREVGGSVQEQIMAKWEELKNA